MLPAGKGSPLPCGEREETAQMGDNLGQRGQEVKTRVQASRRAGEGAGYNVTISNSFSSSGDNNTCWLYVGPRKDRNKTETHAERDGETGEREECTEGDRLRETGLRGERVPETARARQKQAVQSGGATASREAWGSRAVGGGDGPPQKLLLLP